MGHGPPLLMATGLTAEHTNPTGFERRMMYRMMAPFAEHFTVYGANRKPGLAPGTTMSDLAGHYAEAIEHDIGEPVFLLGASTGGSVSLQLAIERPDLVRRLVLQAAACRLAPRGRHAQAEVARLTKEGDHRGAWAQMAAVGAPRALRNPARALVPEGAAKTPYAVRLVFAERHADARAGDRVFDIAVQGRVEDADVPVRLRGQVAELAGHTPFMQPGVDADDPRVLADLVEGRREFTVRLARAAQARGDSGWAIDYNLGAGALAGSSLPLVIGRAECRERE